MSIRLRVALLFSGMFVAVGALLLSINYFAVQHHETTAATGAGIICRSNAIGSGIAVPISGNVQCGSGPLGTPPPDFGPGGIGGGASGTIGSPTPLQVAQRVLHTTQSDALHTLLVVSIVALLACAVLSLLLGWLMAGRVLRPVRRMTETARRLSQETLHERIAMSGPDDELRELADTFDAMLERLEGAFDSQRRFVANASHELRTPLATERVLIDEALAHPSADVDDLRGILRQLRSTSEDSERLLDALLVLARSEREVDGGEEADLATLATTAMASVTMGSVAVRTDLARAPVRGDVTLLTRMIANLVDNAVRYNLPSGGTVDVSTAHASRAVLTVTNTGPPVTAGQIPTLFEPFTRLDGSRIAADGSGLGLSIVAAVVASHHGRIDTTPGPQGGLTIRVELPAAVPDRGEPE